MLLYDNVIVHSNISGKIRTIQRTAYLIFFARSILVSDVIHKFLTKSFHKHSSLSSHRHSPIHVVPSCTIACMAAEGVSMSSDDDMSQQAKFGKLLDILYCFFSIISDVEKQIFVFVCLHKLSEHSISWHLLCPEFLSEEYHRTSIAKGRALHLRLTVPSCYNCISNK